MYEYDERVKQLAAKNLGSRKIAAQLGISPAVVYKILRRLNLVTSKTNNLEPITEKNEIKFSKSAKIDIAAEIYLIYLCELSGFSYCTPSRRSKYDLLVDFGDGFKKIQVKSSSTFSKGKCNFTLKTTRHNSTQSKNFKYLLEDVDYFFLHNIDGRSWLIPHSLLFGQGAVMPEDRFKNFEIIL